ncbi:FAD/NAD(P)-binding domain-containing protein [Coccomyxa subellipsoidea C-169]|uniref:FAD/NAD(P)-binding domain-containing protein n=1 Tax=Coccomyxa subellipsoidea (strain C-169) TaxID=574566 RepID=I0YQH3_COCSC|nr:FAD/NAD(P)-binding domain-containing protein [Coccomyxa subellipsoidea C-169]EIE20642.1 FAD/NAD(P)-binding domain-containing protein [Coccomyxa subellipsoidea C-169]|eukprot:XP_005645186.1 FAD/NAD(P)-binding domain-containing protein [Coccomyxa subellipsoidea C-169]
MALHDIDVSDKVLICGGGIGGLALGVALAKVGIPAVVLERGEQLRSAGAGIRLQTNAWHALEQLGVADTLRKEHIRMESLEVTRDNGRYLGGATYRDDEENRGVVRDELIVALAAGLPKGSFYLSSNVQSVRIDERGNGVAVLKSGKELRPKMLVGADGVNSRVTKALGFSSVAYSGQAEAKTFNNEKALQYLHSNAEHIAEQFNMPLWLSHINPEDIYAHQLKDRAPDKDKAWGKGTVTLIGDAAHPTTPFLGQGGAMALEDSVELAAMLYSMTKSEGGWEKASPQAIAEALRAFELKRAPRCHDMVQLGRKNGAMICMKRSRLGVLLRDLFIMVAARLTRVSFYTDWDVKLTA